MSITVRAADEETKSKCKRSADSSHTITPRWMHTLVDCAAHKFLCMPVYGSSTVDPLRIPLVQLAYVGLRGIHIPLDLF